MIVFESESIASGSSIKSVWIQLFDFFSAHAINGKFVSTLTTGKLAITYEISSQPGDAFAVSQGTVFAAATDSSSPLLKSLQLRASNFIRFTATASVQNITAFTMHFMQTGRGS